MNNKSNFWKQVTYVMKTIMEHINISYDGANKSVQIRIVSTEVIIPGISEPPVRTLRATIPENESHIFR